MWPRNYCLGAVIGPFFITAGGNFEVDMITDEDNPKKELKIFKCAGKNACPHIFMVTISGIQRKRDYVTPIGRVILVHNFFVELRIAGLHVLV